MGARYLAIPSLEKLPHTRSFLGGRSPIIRAITHNVMAAIPTLRVTIVNRGSSVTTIPTKKNDPPHSTESKISIAHTRAFIEVLIEITQQDTDGNMN